MSIFDKGMFGRHPTPLCQYCQTPAVLTKGSALYPSLPHLFNKWFWVCSPCNARVGCHAVGAFVFVDGVRVESDGTLPLGSLANPELRRLRTETHRVFDSWWRQQGMTRTQAYFWLAGALGIDPKDCHVSQFDPDRCRSAIAAVISAMGEA